MEDFNVDSGEWFPDQLLDGNPTECVGICVADICGDIDNVNYDPDFSYAMALKLMGVSPTTAGSDPHTGMLAAVAYGCLPMSDADFSAITNGELYVSNWQNYSVEDRQTAQTHVQKGVKVIPIDFDGVLEEAQKNKGVGFALTWHTQFNTPNPDGTVTVGGFTTNHFARIVGQKTLNGVPCMIVKPWLGKSYGLGGYCLLSKDQFYICGKSAFSFDPNANRLGTLVGIAVTRFPYLLDILPYLFKIGIKNLQTIVNA